MPGHRLDHLVMPVRDLDRVAGLYEALGFTVTARGIHPWGTWNRLVQFSDRSFLELLTVGEPAKIMEAAPGVFSFGAFNRDFLAAREGASMLVLNSEDTAATRAEWARLGLPVYAPFGFRRIARAPDGSEREVAFSLTFTSDAGLPHAAFFACEHHYPENFWRAELQRHANGVEGVAAVTMIARDPSDHHDFLWKMTGNRDYHVTGAGLAFAIGTSTLDVLTPEAFAERFGVTVAADYDARFAAITFRGARRADVADRARAAGVPVVAPSENRLVIPAEACAGTVLAFAG